MSSKQLDLFETEVENKANYLGKSYIGIYGMHKYWSKKPYNIIRNFISQYTKRGEVVLDPFCGSGVSVAEAVFTGRKAIGIDINPSAIFITKQIIKKVSPNLIYEEFKRMESDLKDKINSLYIVKRGGEKYIGSHFIWENNKLAEVWYKERGRIIVNQPNEDDVKLANSFSYKKINDFYPKNSFFHNPRINANRQNHIYDLFTPRNLLALSLLMKRIEEVKNKDVKELLKFCFTASIGQSSKMVFVVKQRGKFNSKSKISEKKSVGSWVIGYWVPKENFEINVWNCYINKFRKILKAKGEQVHLDYMLYEAVKFQELSDSGNLLLLNKPAQAALKNIPNNSIDYVITDPPHGNRQPYLELALLWNSWLKKSVNYEDEIVISESKDRRKNPTEYYKLLKETFSEIERVLKPYCHFSLMFNSLDDETWLNLLKDLNSFHFELEKIETLEYSAKSVVQDTRSSGLKTDFILTFKKNPKKIFKDTEFSQVDNNREYYIHKINGYLDMYANSLETYQILNFLVSDMLQQNKSFKLSKVLDLLNKEFIKLDNRWTKNKR